MFKKKILVLTMILMISTPLQAFPPLLLIPAYAATEGAFTSMWLWVVVTTTTISESIISFATIHPVVTTGVVAVAGEVTSKVDPTGIIDLATSVDPRKLTAKGLVKGAKSLVRDELEDLKEFKPKPKRGQKKEKGKKKVYKDKRGKEIHSNQVLQKYTKASRTVKVDIDGKEYIVPYRMSTLILGPTGKASIDNCQLMRKGWAPFISDRDSKYISDYYLVNNPRYGSDKNRRIELHHIMHIPVLSGKGIYALLPGILHNPNQFGMHTGGISKGIEEAELHGKARKGIWTAIAETNICNVI